MRSRNATGLAEVERPAHGWGKRQGSLLALFFFSPWGAASRRRNPLEFRRQSSKTPMRKNRKPSLREGRSSWSRVVPNATPGGRRGGRVPTSPTISGSSAGKTMSSSELSKRVAAEKNRRAVIAWARRRRCPLGRRPSSPRTSGRSSPGSGGSTKGIRART